MKLAVLVLSLFLVLNPSRANTNLLTQDPGFRERSVSKTPTQTKNVRVLAGRKAQRRLLITNDLSDGNDGPPGPDELDLQSPYQRPRLTKKSFDTDDISDYATVRLAVARARAMEVYRQKWC